MAWKKRGKKSWVSKKINAAFWRGVRAGKRRARGGRR